MGFKPTSPYAKTPTIGRLLSYYVHRKIPADKDDAVMLLGEGYALRPDLLALDLYGSEELWWIVPQRNGLQDPIYDLQPGVFLFIPSPSLVQRIIK